MGPARKSFGFFLHEHLSDKVQGSLFTYAQDDFVWHTLAGLLSEYESPGAATRLLTLDQRRFAGLAARIGPGVINFS